MTSGAEGRGIAKDDVERIEQGRGWTGNQAWERGLRDGSGGMEKAIEEAAKLADLEDYALRSFPKKVDFWASLLMDQKEELATKAMKEYLGSDYKTFIMIKEIKDQDHIQARLPYDVEVK